VESSIRLITISGPRGAGKGTILDALMSTIPGLRRVVPHTTRVARAYEVNGREYHFVSRADFDRLRLHGEFVWWSHIGPTQLAGTTYDELRQSSRGSVLDVLPSGAVALRDKIVEAGGSAFLMAVHASREERARRIAKRQPDLSRDDIQRLLDEDPAPPDLHHYRSFDLIIRNSAPDAGQACSHAVAAGRAFLGESLSDRSRPC